MMKKLFYGLLLIIFLFISVFVTTCMFNRDDYGIIRLGNYKLYVVTDDSNDKGSLFVFNDVSFNVNDRVMFIDDYSLNVAYIKSVNDDNVVMDNSSIILDRNVLGKSDNVSKYKYFGAVLSVLESKYGYLLFIVMPIIFILLYEIVMIINFFTVKKED